jgi:hypothetical protein
VSAGCEIGLHGIDAWLESSSGREEAQQVSKISRRPEGVRMHWLYQDEKSPKALEEAGFSYDSTVGYNETVGYRAGTSQVFKPLQAERLLELPMHVMDTALFYPSYLNLSQDDARERILPFCENAARHGGVITVNWHDRSIAPERLWGDFYTSLVEELSMRGAWFSTAGEAVAWFRKRRSAVFEEVVCEGGRFQVKVTAVEAESLPGLRLRFHRPWTFLEPAVALMKDHEDYVDMGFDGHIDADFRMDHHFEPDQAS